MTINSRSVALVGIALLTVAGISACAEIRKATYPPNFTYIETKQVRTTMDHFASGLYRIDTLLAQSMNDPLEVRQVIIEELLTLESLSDTVGAGTQKTNHLLIDDRIGEFKADVLAARRALEESPPNFYLAGRLAGSCRSCHINR